MTQMGVKETLCTSCEHREVCSYKEKFLKAVNAVDDCMVSYPNESEPCTYEHIRLCDISWIKPVELRCKFYMEKGIGIR